MFCLSVCFYKLSKLIYCPKFFSRLLFVVVVFYSLLPSKVLASEWLKYPGNPIFRPTNSGGWDSADVQNPNIVKVNNTYNMWYDGLTQNVSGWKLGYAYSSDGLSNWTRTQQPIFPPGSTDGWETETADPFVIYNQLSSEYKMWYTSINGSNWISGPDRFRTRFASLVNNNWIKADGWIDSLKGITGSWDNGGTARGRSVLYKDDIYHMWYAATNSDNLVSSPYWRIGYATSIDGIRWEKQNQGNPIVIQGESTTLNISYPTVLFANGIYHMLYVTDPRDSQTLINYAYSEDGIIWTKPADQSLGLTRGPQPFDSSRIAPYTIFNEDQTLKLWYSGFDGSHWSIGYATAPASLLGPPTPSPTPTNTPTPTPTPAGPRKVVVLPGMGGSWNRDALLNCKLDNYSGNWGPWTIKNENIYQPLIDALQTEGYTPLPFWYDWRKQVSNTAFTLDTFIQNNAASGETVDLVGHSLGGLIGRAYLEQAQVNNRLDKLLTVGSAHQGVVIAYPAWSGGALWSNDIRFRLGATLLKAGCMLRYNWSARETINRAFPSMQNVLPTFDYLKDKKTGAMKPVSGMNAQNNWLPTPFASPFFGVTVGTLAGSQSDTLKTLEVIPPNRADLRLGNWLDGKPTNNRTYEGGDGTVLTESSQLAGAQNTVLPLNHGALVNSQTGINAIIAFLSGEPASQQFSPMTMQEPGNASALLIVVDGATATITDANGNKTQDSDGQITILDPHDEAYSLTLHPRWWKPKYRVIVIQLFDDGTSVWKEYPEKGFFSKYWKLRFDRRTHSNDILNVR